MRRRTASLLGALRASCIAPLAVALVVYLVVLYSAGYNLGADRHAAGNPSVLIYAGPEFAKNRSLLPDDIKLATGSGYDGQFYFYLAQDPFLTGKVARPSDRSSPVIDHLAYRYQRILFPLVAWLGSGTTGDPNVLQWVLPIINLLAVLGSGFLLARFLAARGRSPWWSLAYMLSLGLLAGTVTDLADPFATGLFLAGVLWWYDDRRWPAVVALALAPLAREVFILPVAALALLELLRLRRSALPFLIPVGVWLGWQAYLRTSLAAPVLPAGAERPQILPLQGVIDRLGIISDEHVVGAANWEMAFIVALLVACGYLLWRGAVVIAEAVRAKAPPGTRERVLLLVAAATVVLIPLYTSPLWRTIQSYSRYAAPIAGLLLMIFAVRRSRAAVGLAVILLGLTLVNPVIALVPERIGPVVSPPPVAIPPAAAAKASPASPFSPQEGGRGEVPWRWAVARRSALPLAAPALRGRRVTMRAGIAAPPGRAVIVVVRYPDGSAQTVTANDAPTPVAHTFTVPRRGGVVTFTTGASPYKAPNDPRPLYFQVVGLALSPR